MTQTKPPTMEQAERAIEALKVPGYKHLNPMDDWISVGVVRSILQGKHPILATLPRTTGEEERDA